MTTQDREIFEEARIIADPVRRAEFLDEACAGNDAQRQQFDLLFRADETATQAQASGGVETTESSGSARHAVEAEIGPYRLIKALGEGGMGTVYLAEQVHPIRRSVALKLVKAGLDGQTIIPRFEAERQALAMMDHPNIAKVLDAGTTSKGQPYFVMELVRGVPITDYCNDRRLTIPERLKLMIPVCQAIQHAHQKGLIHRDIKPSNILVSEPDGAAVPKVIDFGIAKAIGPAINEHPSLTQVGTIVGTLEYMSPEQADSAWTDIDTRSDIYSLGVVLYELLTGTTPLPMGGARKAGYAEVLRRIREDEPLVPSGRLTSSRETLGAVSAQRATNPSKLAKLVEGELDWIVMKALEKDRARRFETANGLARDLERYLQGEPVEAGPPSATYRTLKFASKYRWPLAAAASFAALLVSGVMVSTWQAVRARSAEQVAQSQRDRAVMAEGLARQGQQVARQERDRAVSAEAIAQTERAAALTEKTRADGETAIAKAVNEFVQNDLLAQATASGQMRQNGKPDPDLKVRVALDRAAQRIENRFRAQPLVEESIRGTIAESYTGLGLNKEALEQLQRTLELRRRRLGERHPDTLQTWEEIGKVESAVGDYAAAEKHLMLVLNARRALLGEHAAATLSAKQSLAELYGTLTKFREARGLLEEVIADRRRSLGAHHPVTLSAEIGLAEAYLSEGKLNEAERLMLKVLEDRRRRDGADHPAALDLAKRLAEGVYLAQGNYAKAEALLLETVEAERRVLGSDHIDLFSALNALANVYFRQGKYSRAEELNAQILERQTRLLGKDHLNTLNTMINLAICHRAQGKYTQAESIYLQVIETGRRVLGEEHRTTVTGMQNLAVVYSGQGKDQQAEELYSRVLAIRTKTFGPDSPATLNSLQSLGLAIAAQKRFPEAEALFTKTLDTLRRGSNLELPISLSVMHSLAVAYTEQGKYNQAESLLRECLVLREKVSPDAWERYQTLNQLGQTLLLQKRFAEAEPNLVSGYQGMMDRYAKIAINARAGVARSGARIVQLYEQWGKSEKASEWRAKIASSDAGPREE